ncbi:guanine-1-methyltransferase-domain-containing protein [Scheffersomyces amazonensis]|uniref:guanine-1-methyltransferase-domain-containing protein n=1 Tax=Scheffersomyces amazonensis TaxID=1078765 RepID=UPI00315D63BA
MSDQEVATKAAKKRNPPPTAEEIEQLRQAKQSVVLPDGMSKNEWKRIQKQKKWEETKEEYRQMKRVKKKAARKRKHQHDDDDNDNENKNYHTAKKTALPTVQSPTDVKIIFDCEFDDLMNTKEIVSMSNQITRSYSAMRHCTHSLPITVSSFNKNLKSRFDKSVPQYTLWNKNITFNTNDTLSDLLNKEDLSQYVYLTADTDEVIESLEPHKTYIIGGIVDKNRHKLLCVNKAKELGLKVGKLPIDKYIEINGRHVLATSHVYELCCKWFENNGDWETAFNQVLPPRKKSKNEPINDSEEEPSTESNTS